MEWLNYHHLLYFYTVAREGGLAPAARVLNLAHPTISSQIHRLEDALGEKLFRRAGRRLEMTEMGQVVYRYAEEIFGLGQEMLDVVRGRATGRPVKVLVGVADALPKLVVHRLLEPARRLPEPVVLVVHEDKSERLLGDLSMHALDVVLADAPLGPGTSVKAFNHLLGECGVSIFGVSRLAARHRRGFPGSLDGAPMLLPTDNTTLRRSLDLWFQQKGIRPQIVAEIGDSALLKTIGHDGLGLFPAPAVVESQVRRQFGVQVVGRLAEVKERFYAVTIERKLRHPAVAAICQAAREELFKA